jgi:hypothetical protein
MEKKPLLPKLFRDENTLEELTGVYVPFWLYDCSTKGAARYHATKVTTWSDSRYDYTRTDYYQLLRAGQASFDKVPVDGSEKMDNAFMEAVEPYDYQAVVPFQTTYLSGFLANRYDASAQECQPRAEQRVKTSLKHMLASTAAGYTTCTVESLESHIYPQKTQYAMLPVWVLNVKYREKLYRFAMNGQTGKFVGELPVDKGRAAAWFWGLFGSFSLVSLVLALLFR